MSSLTFKGSFKKKGGKIRFSWADVHALYNVSNKIDTSYGGYMYIEEVNHSDNEESLS